MGRKSTAKKNRRIEDKEKEEEPKKGFLKKLATKSSKKESLKKISSKDKKKTKAESEKKSKKKKKKLKLKLNRKKIFGSVLTVILLAILVSVGYLLFQKAFRAQPIAKILPADRTIALAEVNTNFEHNQSLKTFHLLKNYPQFSREELIEKIATKLTLNYEQDIKPWVGRSVGIAILNPKDPEEKIQTLYFIEVLNQKNARKFIDKRKPSKSDHEKQITYMLEGPLYLVFIEDYMVLSESEMAIYELLDDRASLNLYSDAKYRKIDNNLPLNKVAFFYTDFDKMTDSLFQNFPILSENGLSMSLVEPILNLFDAEGISLIAMNENFAIQSFLSLDQEVVEKIDYLNYQERYTANLTNFIAKDNLAFWGGENMEYQLKRIIELLAGGEEGALEVFDALLQNYTQKYFGSDMDFEKDILPLFSNEFAFNIEKFEEENVYKLLLELDSPQEDVINLHEIANSFAKVGAIFEPKIVEHILEDGTVTKEIVAVPEEVAKGESNYKGITISELKMGKQGWGIYYALIDNVAVIATHIEGVKSSIDTAKGDLISFNSTELFTKHVEPLLRSSDEISYFNIEALIPMFFDEEVPEALGIVGSLSSGRNYFNDGIVTINYLHIK
ncbi:MAG: DUF3352 domain-containing protein [bacterium]|nr:DUF3352 domain-containing protein [bacterium]